MFRPECAAHFAPPAGDAVGSDARPDGRLPAGLEVVEGPGHVVGREGEEERRYRIGPGLGVALDVGGGQLIEVRAHGDTEIGPAAAGRLEVRVELGQPLGQLGGTAVEGVPALTVPRCAPEGGRCLTPDVDRGLGLLLLSFSWS